MENHKIRKANSSDVKDILRLLIELAVYEKEPNAVKVTESDLIRDGFGQSPKFECILAEFNSEIVGKYTGSSFGVVFKNNGETLPRHPVQLYESLGYFIVFIILFLIYKNTTKRNQKGFLIGAFFTLLFGVRFLAEFVKESQGGFGESIGYLSTGQWLSIPLILLGLILIAISYKTKANA